MSNENIEGLDGRYEGDDMVPIAEEYPVQGTFKEMGEMGVDDLPMADSIREKMKVDELTKNIAAAKLEQIIKNKKKEDDKKEQKKPKTEEDKEVLKNDTIPKYLKEYFFKGVKPPNLLTDYDAIGFDVDHCLAKYDI